MVESGCNVSQVLYDKCMLFGVHVSVHVDVDVRVVYVDGGHGRCCHPDCEV